MIVPEHLKTPADLLAEGRRWVLYPGQDENGVFRAEAVFEDHPFRFPLGAVSNDPDVPPPITFGTDRDEAEEAVLRWNAANHGITPKEYRMILASSMGAQNKMRRVKVIRDPDTSVAVVFDGYGEPALTLEEDEARRLYLQIAQAYRWGHDEFCEECGCVLEDGLCPEGCEDEDEQDEEDD